MASIKFIIYYYLFNSLFNFYISDGVINHKMKSTEGNKSY
jgi:hypothetical protein